MKSFIHIIAGICLACLSAFSQSQDQNYIRTRTMTNDAGTEYIETIQYFDGLGRPVETVQKGITPNKADLVSLLEYDAFGRESNVWLPGVASGNNGAFIANPKAAIKASYGNDANPYARTDYEASPLNRVEKQFGPGRNWHANGKAVKTEYSANTASGDQSCAYYEVTSDGKLKKTGNYEANQLYVVKITDEDGCVSYEFKDRLGRVVLMRQTNGTIPHSTYYVYDDFGKKRFVLSPMASDTLTADGVAWDINNQTLKDYAYMYKYDNRLRCSEKKLPGADWIYYVYDRADRLILMQDGKTRAESSLKWIFSKYDVTGRMIITGFLYDNRNFAALTSFINSTVIVESYGNNAYGSYGYTWNTFPTSAYEDDVMVVNYYDDYERLLSRDPYFGNALGYETKAGYGTKYTNTQCSACSAKGLLIGTRTKMLDGSSGEEIVTMMYYDDKGRLVQKKSTNHLDGFDKEYYAYSFTGLPLKTLAVNTTSSGILLEQYCTYAYDHAGRQTSSIYQIDKTTNGVKKTGTPQTARIKYDETGRAIRSETGVNVDYTYNIRGWVTDIKQLYFTEKLWYEQAGFYNGNIAKMYWTGSYYENLDDSYYVFTYDKLNRLMSAVHTSGTRSNALNTSYAYDKNGNIKNLTRYGLQDQIGYRFGFVDQLTFSHSGNQITSVSDAGLKTSWYGAEDYHVNSAASVKCTYNANGFLTKDSDKGIQNITYNYLNLPEKITFGGGNSITYHYDAAGVKRRVLTKTNKNTQYTPLSTITAAQESASQYQYTHTDYIGNILLTDGKPNRASLPGGNGYAAYEPGNDRFRYNYYVKDHLGSVRLVMNDYEVEQSNHYYPFGALAGGSFNYYDGDGNRFKYNGKEMQAEHRLNWYDHGARAYDQAKGSFLGIDPLAEKYPWVSPYAFCGNNPMNRIDPDGMDWWSTSDPDEIERFMNTVKQSTTFGDPTSTKYHEDFDLNNWDRATDSQFSRGKLSYDDFNERFLVSVPGINGEELICYGFYVPAIFVDGSIVGIDTGLRNWHARRSGALTNVYPEFDLLLLSRLLYSGASAVVSEDVAAEGGGYVVYHSVHNGVTQYVGITNNLARRSAEHLASKGIKIEPLLQGLSRNDARAVEQALIEIHGLGKNGGTLLNKINSISPANPTYGAQLQRGYELLKSIGY